VDFLTFAVLSLALFGLAAVLAETFVKSPGAFLALAGDSEAFARAPLPARRAAEAGARLPANDRLELAA
jgi:hypothetical protein